MVWGGVSVVARRLRGAPTDFYFAPMCPIASAGAHANGGCCVSLGGDLQKKRSRRGGREAGDGRADTYGFTKSQEPWSICRPIVASSRALAVDSPEMAMALSPVRDQKDKGMQAIVIFVGWRGDPHAP